MAFFFLFFLHGTSIGNGLQGISYNVSRIAVRWGNRSTKFHTTTKLNYMNKTLNLNEMPHLQQYDVSSRVWVMRNDLKEQKLWTSQWWCDDGDDVELYIDKDKGGFELNCFSGIPASHIYIDVVDFGIMWNKAFNSLMEEVKPIQKYTHVQQCIMLADWLCSIFCKWTDVSDYKRS